MPNVSEATLKSAILKYLFMLPHCVPFPTLTGGVYSKKTDSYRRTSTRKGTPDILACYKGRFLAVEVKAKKGRVSPEQADLLSQIVRQKGFAVIAYSVEDVVKVIRLIEDELDSELL